MALDGVVMSMRTASGSRYVSSYTGVSRASGGGVELQEYVSFDEAEHSWTLVREPAFIERAVHSGALDREEVQRWRSSCPA